MRAIGVDGYNQTLTGEVTMTVTCSASDFHHVPLCIMWRNREMNRLGVIGEQKSRDKSDTIALGRRSNK